MVFHREWPLATRTRCCWIDVTGPIRQMLGESGVVTGLCQVSSLHTTAGMTINENADPAVAHDFFAALERLAPPHAGYRHTEGNSDSHIKASLVGLAVHVPIDRSSLVLGTWQSVYFCEFDGPRSRRISVTIIGG